MAFGVSGSGDAKINASRIALSSPLTGLGRAWFPSGPSGPSSPSCPSGPSCFSSRSRPFSATMFLRISDRMRRVGRPRSPIDAQRSEAARLVDAHELETNHLEQREKRDDETALVGEV